MTRSDIEHLAQVMVALRSLEPQEFMRMIDRMLWAIRSSHDNPHFDEQKFRAFIIGESNAGAPVTNVADIFK
jgi:hypothetical protein